MKKLYSPILFLYKNSLFRCLGVLAIISTIPAFSTCSQISSQKDFYGTWVCKGGTSEMTYVISERTFTSNFNRGIFERNAGLEILSWRKITNEDEDTKSGYPAGFELELRFSGEAGLEQLSIHRNKRSIINSVGDLLIKQSGPSGEKNLSRTEHTQEYDLCLGVLQGNLAMIEDAIKRGANVNLLNLKGEEARTIRRLCMYWYVDSGMDDSYTREWVDQFFEKPPSSVNLDELDGTIGELLIVPAVNDNIDIVRALLESGISVDPSLLSDESIPLNEPMRALFMDTLQKQH
jgi:hypothetical protein